MQGKQPKEDYFVSDIVQHWPILLFLLGMAVTWGVFSNRIANDDTRLDKIESKQEVTDKTLIDIRTDLATINANIAFIKDKVK